MKIAVEGCMHGELDNVYATLLHLQKVENIKIDLLIWCGDFQAVRNVNDLNSLDAINKHRRMNSFWKYYSGERVAPFPTIFIGGNHEASNYLWELYYGGWAAPNIYFLGFAGVIKFGDVRIAGISGDYNGRSYYKGHYEKLPYNTKDVETVYHVREYEVHKLMQVEEPIDIFLSHDWPLHITDCGNLRNLLRVKPFFEDEIREGTLGNPAATELMLKLKPPYWFSAHLHCKFAALVQHPGSDHITKFLALDKCLPKRNFLQVIDIESGPGSHELHYDEEWLAITRKFNPVFPLTKSMAHLSNAKLSIHECREFVKNKLRNRGYKPFEFVRTAPCHNPLQPGAAQVYPCGESLVGAGQVRNPQTVSLVQLLELEYFLDSSTEAHKPTQGPQSFISSGSLHINYKNSEEIDIDDEDDIDELEVVRDPEGRGCKRARKLT